MQPSPLSDEQLANLLRAGDADVIPLLYHRFRNGLFRFAFRMTGDTAMAEDVVHETFIKIMVNGSQLRNTATIKSWIFTIARNEALTMIRKYRHLAPFDENDDNILSDELADNRMVEKEQQSLIADLLDRLLPHYKEVLMLREFETMNYEEIAEVTGTTVASVKSRLFKARKALMRIMEPLRKEGAL